MKTDSTINYYDENAKQYFEKTISADMSAICNRFIEKLRPGGVVIDIGAGSGRDILYFKKHGFAVEGIDASKEMCRLATIYTGTPVECIKIQEWAPRHKYDGVWASASLVHLKETEIKAFLLKLPNILTDDGCAYISFKTGIVTGNDDDGRYFTNVTEEWIRDVIHNGEQLCLDDMWISEDILTRDCIRWINAILKRKHKVE